jgi:hypothetical protein
VNRVEGARVIAASEHGTSGEVAYGELQGKGADEGADDWGEVPDGHTVGWEGGEEGETGSGTKLECETLTLTRLGVYIYAE